MSHRRQHSGKGKGKGKVYGGYKDQNADSSGDVRRQDNYGPQETDQGYQPEELHEDNDWPVKRDEENYPPQGPIDPTRARDHVHSYSIKGQPGFRRWARKQGVAIHTAGNPDTGPERRGGTPDADQPGVYPEDDQHEPTTEYGQGGKEGRSGGHEGYESPSEDLRGYAQHGRTSSQNVEPDRSRSADPYPPRKIHDQGSGHRKHH